MTTPGTNYLRAKDRAEQRYSQRIPPVSTAPKISLKLVHLSLRARVARLRAGSQRMGASKGQIRIPLGSPRMQVNRRGLVAWQFPELENFP